MRFKLLLVGWLLLMGASRVWAQDMTAEAKVTWIVEEGEIEFEGQKQSFQTVTFEIINGPETGKSINYDYGKLPMPGIDLFKVGDRAILGKSDPNDDTSYYLVDRVRRPTLYWLMGLFLGVILLVARKKAIQSLLALTASFVVIFYVVLPQLLVGTSPLLVSILASLCIIPLTFYLSHGVNRKTHIAAGGTLFALLLTAVLSTAFVSWAHLSGYASEDATFLQNDRSFINVKGLLLAGMIIGVLGILDDVTISQASIVEELLAANPKLSVGQLYTKAMNVGKDHIASMINTLILVYVGAAMPLLLLFMNNPKPISEIINYEIVAEEIVRTLTGSIGLVLAVPITTLLASWQFVRRK